MDIDDFEITLNEWGQQHVPFLFMIDFEMRRPKAWRLEEIDPDKIQFSINGFSNVNSVGDGKQVVLEKFPITFEEYQRKFNSIMSDLNYGNSFLANLTIATKVEAPYTLRQLFNFAHARYKLCFDGQFLVFSPETFVIIRDKKIVTHPMKGTIDANLPNAANIILADSKEIAEHTTIVDLLRNDLSRVSNQVRVARFRYLEQIKTSGTSLLQVSSEIEGELDESNKWKLGTILRSLLPAGSISGAPKDKTVQMIRDAEGEPRGYYTGIFGYFDGTQLDSGVMIRYIEQRPDGLYYRSGGGITTQSSASAEYQEALNKVYVPVV